MPTKRQVLEHLKRDELLATLDAFDLSVEDRRQRALLVDALGRSRKAGLTEILTELPRVRLKEICRDMDLDDGGRAKADIVDRILGGEAKAEPPEPQEPHRKARPKKEPRTTEPPAAPTTAAPTTAPGDPPWGPVQGRAEDAGVLEKRLWEAADELRANSKLRAAEYSTPVLGLIFLRYADSKFTHAEEELSQKRRRRRAVGPDDYKARGVLFLREDARFQYLLDLPEGADVGGAINHAMKVIEEDNRELADVLPKTYQHFNRDILIEILKLMGSIPMDIEGDAFGKIYEYFLGKFAMTEGQKGGEFFTPTAIVKLIVDVIEPYHGRILDPACGSGGMFVQSARFVSRHRGNPAAEISVYGQERVAGTVRLCKMNLAVHGLAGDVREANTYYQDAHSSLDRFEYVMANPPFNVNRVDKAKLKDDRRFPFGLPKPDNANYLWIQVFYSALKENGRAGFVMANSASDARGSELEIRKRLLENRAVDVVVAVSSNFFYTVTLPVTLWFLDRGKKGTEREDKILFIDARNVYRQIDRAHRDFTPAQAEFLANIARLYRGEEPEMTAGCEEMMRVAFPEGKYADVSGLCKVVDVAAVEGQGWSLNPGRFVEARSIAHQDTNFSQKLAGLQQELSRLNIEARAFEEQVNHGMSAILKELS